LRHIVIKEYIYILFRILFFGDWFIFLKTIQRNYIMEEHEVEQLEQLDDLDTSWVQNAEIQDDCEREPMENIRLVFVYLDSNFAIEKITKDIEVVDQSIISKERILQLIQIKKLSGKKYKFLDLLSFQVSLEPDQLKDFVSGTIQDDYLKSVPIFDSLEIIPSIFFFHDLNTLFFFFLEIDEVAIKSILKNGNSNRVTKKVRLSPEEYIEKKKKSLKRFIRRANSTRKMQN